MIKTIFNQIDIWLGRLVFSLVISIMYVGCVVVCILAFLALGVYIFEYDLSFSDFDRLEFLGVFLLIVVSIRFFCRGRQQDWSYWCLLRRFCIVTTLLTLADSFLSFFLIAVTVYEQGQITEPELFQYQDIGFFLSIALLVSALYAAAPLPPLFQKNVSIKAPNDSVNIQTEDGRSHKREQETLDPWSVQDRTQ